MNQSSVATSQSLPTVLEAEDVGSFNSINFTNQFFNFKAHSVAPSAAEASAAAEAAAEPAAEEASAAATATLQQHTLN